jgi:hypothetical protein
MGSLSCKCNKEQNNEDNKEITAEPKKIIEIENINLDNSQEPVINTSNLPEENQ